LWEHVSVKGTPPSPRAGHTAVVHGKAMYVYGGYDKNGLSCHDLHEFIFETNTWELLHPKGIHPPDTFHHSAVTYQGSMYVLGGYRTESCSLQEYRFGEKQILILNTILLIKIMFFFCFFFAFFKRYWNLVCC